MTNGGPSLPGKARALAAGTALILVIAPVVLHAWVSWGFGIWSSQDMPVHMRLNLRGTSFNAAAVEALRAWNRAGAHFSFSWTQGAGTARCSRDSEHAVVWADTLCNGVEWGDGVLAIAAIWYEYDQDSRRLVDADVFFNTDWEWSVYSGPWRYPVAEIQRVALHEFGHVLGLDHPDDHGQVRTAIMNSVLGDLDHLAPDDIAGVRALYGSDAPRGVPDLVVQSLHASPSAPSAGASFRLSATVRNVGTGTAAATTLNWRFWRSGSREWVSLGTDSVPSLAPSGGSAETFMVRAPSTPGRYNFGACVAAVAGESNRSNCAEFIRVTVGDGGGGTPDLVVESLRTSPATLRAGGTFTLHATVRNAGTGTAAGTTLRYYHYQSDSRTWERVGTDAVDSLAASGSGAESIVLRAPTETGTHSYSACVGVVAGERDRDNCADTLRVTVTAGDGAPDLVVESLRASPASPTAGESFRLHATVRNLGTGTAAATTLRYYYYRSRTEEWVVLGQDEVVALGPSETSPESLGVRAPSSGGMTSFSACVSRVSGETNRDNNCARTLRVTFR